MIKSVLDWQPGFLTQLPTLHALHGSICQLSPAVSTAQVRVSRNYAARLNDFLAHLWEFDASGNEWWIPEVPVLAGQNAGRPDQTLQVESVMSRGRQVQDQQKGPRA